MARDASARKGHPFLVFFIVLLVIVCLVGGYALALVTSAKRAMTSAQTMVAAVQHVEDAANAGTLSISMLRSNGQQLMRAAADLRSETAGLVWQIAEFIPVYGQDVAAVRTLAGVADDLCANAVTPILDALPDSNFSQLGIVDQATAGLEAIGKLTDVMPGVVSAVQDADAKVDGIGTLHIEQLNSAVEQIRKPLDKVSSALTSADDLVSGITDMLGL